MCEFEIEYVDCVFVVFFFGELWLFVVIIFLMIGYCCWKLMFLRFFMFCFCWGFLRRICVLFKLILSVCY